MQPPLIEFVHLWNFVEFESYFNAAVKTNIKVQFLTNACILESVQNFLIKLDMKSCMHLVEISIFSLNLVIVRLTKIMNRADKNWAHF